MPVYLRRFYYETLNEQKKEEKKHAEGQSTKSSTKRIGTKNPYIK